ncbi:MAG: aldehyde reductase [Deltaproteobacteria bacterium]|nr:aldehyde reductase [Deltaproteobacteria bacterium]
MNDPTTVLVTGASGFIAKHVVLELLTAGYRVVGSVRSDSRRDEVRAAVRAHLPSGPDLDERLRFVTLDLSRDTGWQDAMSGVDVLMHTASPLPMKQPRDENELVRPAVEGTLRALQAAHTAGIRRVVLTSSTAAVTHRPPGLEKDNFDESDWSDPSWTGMSPYTKSKTLAERAAWDFVENEAPDMQLTAINPCLVLGRPLDDFYGTSLRVVERLLRGKDPLLPKVGMGIVDVTDVARMHVRAMTAAGAPGKRLIGAAEFMWITEIAEILKAAYPERRIPLRTAPDFLIRLAGLFDRSIRTIIPLLGRRQELDSSRARALLDMDFIPAAESVRAAGRYIMERGLADRRRRA